MINQYTMQEIEYGYQIKFQYDGGFLNSSGIDKFNNIKKKIEEQLLEIKSMSPFPVSKKKYNMNSMEDFTSLKKKINAILEIVRFMHNEDIVTVAIGNAKVYLDLKEKDQLVVVRSFLKKILDDLKLMFFDTIFDLEDADPQIWEKLYKGDVNNIYPRPAWITKESFNNDILPFFLYFAKSVKELLKPMDVKAHSWMRTWGRKGAHTRDGKYERARNIFYEEMKQLAYVLVNK